MHSHCGIALAYTQPDRRASPPAVDTNRGVQYTAFSRIRVRYRSMPAPTRIKNEPGTLRDFILRGEERLSGADLAYGHGTDSPLDESAWLVGRTLNLSPHEIDDHLERKLTPEEQQAVTHIIDERISTRKPAAYLLREAWFAGMRFYVDERVIVPRSLLGEFILDAFQPWLARDQVHRALDLCTGSGCIAIALARAFPVHGWTPRISPPRPWTWRASMWPVTAWNNTCAWCTPTCLPPLPGNATT